MGKALVIRGVNFSTNKVTTVEIGDFVPCTEITLSDENIELNKIGSTYQIVATLTPEETTDVPEWYSSDESVVTVVDGLVSCVGVGTATITVICGEQTATCNVTAKHIINADTELTVLHQYCLNNSGTKDLVTGNNDASTTYKSYYAIGNPLSGYKAVSRNEERWLDKYPIPIPSGAKYLSIKISQTNIYDYIRYAWTNANLKPTDTSITDSQKGARAYPYPKTADIRGLTIKTYDLTEIDENVNSFVFGFITHSGVDEGTITGVTVTVEFS